MRARPCLAAAVVPCGLSFLSRRAFLCAGLTRGRRTLRVGSCGRRASRGHHAVALPGYLQRPQMVVRRGDDVDIRIEDYHRWGEELSLGIARILSLTMTRDMRARRGVAMPLRTGAPADYRVQVEIRRFEGAPGGNVHLEAAWSLGRDGGTLRDGVFRADGRAGEGMADMVEAQSALLEQLGSELARAVLALDAGNHGTGRTSGR